MKYSLNWLKDFCEITLPLDELSYRLLMLGFEVEGVEEVAGDKVLSVEVTPNRADCLSMEGLAREVAVACGTEFKPREPKLAEVPGDPGVEVIIEAPDLCLRYIARAVTGVKNGPGPRSMGARLEAVGLRPIDILVDATNCVQLEVGQPLHAFDRAKIRGGKIFVRRAKRREKMTLLDGAELELSVDDLVIADAKGPIALAGVMGGAGSEVGPDTTDVIIECAYFDPKAIRRTSKRYGVETESSYRFERGVDPAGIPRAADRTAELMVEFAGGTVVAPAVDAGRTDWAMPAVALRPSRANMLIGFNMAAGEMAGIFRRIYMEVEEKDNDTLIVAPPSFRRDVEREVDLIEELARAYGYDRVEPRLPAGELPPPVHLTKEEVEDRLREILVRGGFFEVYTNSFTSDRYIETGGASSEGAAAITNPISAEYTHLRRTIWPQVVEVAEYNGRQGEAGVMLFELGTVFEPTKKWMSAFLGVERPGLSESYHLAAVAGGTPGETSWYGENRGVDFFLLKGTLESLAEHFGPAGVEIKEVNSAPRRTPAGFDVTRTWEVEVGSCVGWIYELKLNYISGGSYVLELNVTPLITAGAPAAKKYEPLRRLPYVDRDLALLADAVLPAGDLINALDGTDELLESVRIFDVYTGKGIPAGKKSIGIRLRYRADDRTLTDEEANERRDDAVNALKSKFDLEIR